MGEATSQITRDALRRYRRVTVMGLGLFGGGAGAARYFAGLGAKVVVTDAAGPEKLARSVASLDGLDIAFHLGGHLAEDFSNTDLVVTNQAVRPDNHYLEEARKRGVPVVTETGLALALNRSPWAAVTGSSGKSTTAALLAEMLRFHDSDAMFGGNIGGDLLTRIEAHPATAPLTVELSSFQLTYVGGDLAAGRALPPRAAVVTNISPNHLDWHSGMDEYVAAKKNVILHQKPGDWAILNIDDAGLAEWAKSVPARVVSCGFADAGLPDACFVEGAALVLRLDGAVVLRLPLSAFRLMGRHNIHNALQATAAAWAMCGDAKAIAAGFASFSGLPHRLEKVGEAGGRIFVNDSKSTTPEAAILALDAIDGPKVLIAGGYDKKSPFGELAAAIQRKAAGLALVGEAGRRLRAAVEAAAAERPPGLPPLAVADCGVDFDRAVAEAFAMIPEGGAVLLSPACASWGMFANYEERGRRFGELAKEMTGTC